VPTVFKSGSPNLLEPSGPVQACNGIALPFTVHDEWKNFIDGGNGLVYDFYICTIYLDIIKVFYSPTNPQVIGLKTILKFTLK
jgi:hypothetical protein